MAALIPGYDTVAKLTIIPRSNGAGGFTLFTPDESRSESGLYSLKFLKGQLAVALGGRVAEELVYGSEEGTTGASNDLQQVRNIARRMVAQWGFSGDSLSPIAWEPPESPGMFAGSTARRSTRSWRRRPSTASSSTIWSRSTRASRRRTRGPRRLPSRSTTSGVPPLPLYVRL